MAAEPSTIDARPSDADIQVTGRHMNIGEAFRTRITERLHDMVAKHFHARDGWSASVTVDKNAGRYDVECIVRPDHGSAFQAQGQAHDPDAAFEEAAERVEKRLRRHQRRLKEHRSHKKGLGPEATEIAYRVLTAPAQESEVEPDFAPTIVAESVRAVAVMTVAEAVLNLDMSDVPVLVFRNAKSDALNLVYRRGDGNVGWLDTTGQGVSAPPS